MKRKTEAKRQQIIDIARKIFIELGYEQASMSKISENLGGSKATLYNYFGSKEELFYATLLVHIQTEFQIVQKALNLDTNDISKALYTFGEKFLTFIYSNQVKEIRRLSIRECSKIKFGKTTYELGPKRGHKVISSFLEEANKQKQLCIQNPQVATQHLLALLESETLIPFLMNVKTEFTQEELKAISKRAIDVFLRAYKYKE
jgi:AcrR family transcriptional regulator